MKFSKVLLLALLILVVSCGPPSNNNPTRYGTFYVAITNNDWPSDNVAWIREAVMPLSRLGPNIEFVPDGDPRANVTIRHATYPDCNRISGQYIASTRTAEVDPVCTPGAPFFRSAIAHEVIHAMGVLTHLCDQINDTNCSSRCSRLTGGLMNRGIRINPGSPTLEEVWAGPFPFVEPTTADICLYRESRMETF